MIEAETGDLTAQIQEATGGGASGMVETTGNIRDTQERAFAIDRRLIGSSVFSARWTVANA